MCCAFPLCNKKPERAPNVNGHTFPLCWRCTGLVLGALAGYISLLFIPPIGLCSYTLLLPIGIDGGLQYLGGVLSTNTRRFVTGFIGGLSVLGG